MEKSKTICLVTNSGFIFIPIDNIRIMIVGITDFSIMEYNDFHVFLKFESLIGYSHNLNGSESVFEFKDRDKFVRDLKPFITCLSDLRKIEESNLLTH